MEKRTININNKPNEVSLLGFGCMRFPEKDGKIDREKSIEMMQYALQHGVNYIDTAYPYHGGDSEIFVSEVIKNLDRSSFFLADKLPIWDCETKEDVDRIFHEQLEKCKVEYFDFYLIHAMNKKWIERVKNLDIISQLEQYKKEGKIRNIGCSFHDDLDTFKTLADLYQWDFVQIQLNYMDTEHQQGITGYNILTEKNIPVVVMEPVKGGSLASFHPDIEQKLTDYNKNVSIASWAFRWVGSLPNVKVILSGMSTLEQVQDNIKTFENFVPLNDEELTLIESVKQDIIKRSKVDCTSCNYCMPCPHGVNIPGNFRIFNHHAMYNSDRYAKWAIGNLKNKDAYADQCINCGECLPKCPQFIDIPTELEKFDEYARQNGL